MKNLAAVLAIGLAVVACQQPGARPSSAPGPADSADQVMLKMDSYMSQDGVRKNYVVAETAYIYQAAQKMDLRRLKVTFFDNTGRQSSVLTAKQGMYMITLGSLDARGNVVVVSTDGRKLTTPHLIYDRSAMQLRSDTVFYYESKTETMTGISFKSDLEFRDVHIDNPKGKQRGAGVLLPGQ